MMAFVPNVAGHPHIGNLMTYFANWLASRKYNIKLVIIPDVGILNYSDDNLMEWRLKFIKVLENLDIMPDRFLTIEEVKKNHPGPVMPVTDNILKLCYVCECPDYPTPIRHTHDVCLRNLNYVSEKCCLRLKKNNILVGCVSNGKFWLHFIVPFIQMLQNIGVWLMIRGEHLGIWVKLQEDIIECLGPGLRWNMIKTFFGPTLVHNDAKLSKSTGAVPAYETIKIVGKMPLLKALFRTLQAKPCRFDTPKEMVADFDIMKIPCEGVCVHRMMKVNELDDGFYSKVDSSLSRR